jgi:hypothetical protein
MIGRGVPRMLPVVTVFPSEVAEIQKDNARFASLVDDLEKELFGTFPDKTRVCP